MSATNYSGFTYGGFMFPCDPWERRNLKRNARYLNNREFQNWFAYLCNLYMNLFEWKGLPETVNQRFLKETLFWDGKALFFKDPMLGCMALPCAGEGNMNVYWEYTKFRAVSNEYDEVYRADESVLIRENQIMYPPLFVVEIYAQKIADMGRSIDVYGKTMKKPWLLTSEQDDKLTQKTLVEEIDQNELLVVGAKRLGGDSMKAYANPQDGQGLLALWRGKHEILDEVLTWFGINNANTEKRERLITAEVESNNQLVQLNTDTALDWQKKACEEINKMFGLNVSVDLNHDYLKEAQQAAEKQGEEDGAKNTGA